VFIILVFIVCDSCNAPTFSM